MSVHGEFHRALHILRVRLSESEFLLGKQWLDRLEYVRAEANRDLSTAARTSLGLLAELTSDLDDAGPRESGSPASHDPLPSLELLRDACHHLRAHCCAILGVRSDGQ